jgi:hypothetical protein
MARYVVTNLRFPEQTYRELRYAALRRGVSVASLVRESVDRYLGRNEDDKPIPFGEDPFDKWIGAFHGSAGDESVNHDHYLYGWPKETELEASGGHKRASGPTVGRRRKASERRRLQKKKPSGAIRPDRAHPRGARNARSSEGGGKKRG